MLHCLLVLFSCFCGLHLLEGRVIEPVLEISAQGTNVTDGTVTETQHAICKIVTEDATANARASVTRVLNGACDAKTMNEKFKDLEEAFIEELLEIKSILYYAILEKNADVPNIKKTLAISRNMQQDDFDFLISRRNRLSSPRQDEINEYNNTIREVNDSVSVFTYYWPVDGFDEKIDQWETGRTERSPTFAVGKNGWDGSYAMYLAVTPRYFPDGTVFVGVGLTRGSHDAVLQWPFPLQTRIEILDQSTTEPRQDRSSRLWDPFMLCSEYFWGRPKPAGYPDNPVCVGLSVPRRVILAKTIVPSHDGNKYTRYIWNGSLLVKFSVFFQSYA